MSFFKGVAAKLVIRGLHSSACGWFRGKTPERVKTEIVDFAALLLGKIPAEKMHDFVSKALVWLDDVLKKE